VCRLRREYEHGDEDEDGDEDENEDGADRGQKNAPGGWLTGAWIR